MPIASSDASQPEPPPRTTARPAAAVRRPRATGTYIMSCLVFSITVLVLGILNKEIPFARIAYVTMMFVICAGPFLLGRGNPRHRLVSIFMGIYFMLFAIGGLAQIIDGAAAELMWGQGALKVSDSSALTASDFVVIIGGLCFLAGYFLTDRARGRRHSKFLANEWRHSSVMLLGFVMWLIGFIFMLAYDSTVSVFYMPKTILGVPLSAASNLKFLSPMGAVMLIYLFTREYRTALIGTLLAVIIGSEFVFGFIASSKEISFRIAVLFLLGLYYVRGRVNLKIIAVMLIVSIPYMLYFNAYRMQMMEGGFKNPAEAFAKFAENLDVVKSKTEREDEVAESSIRSLSGRIDHKVYIDIIVAGTEGGKVPMLYGESLGYFFTSFVPRALWPNKPVTTTGQMFNRMFGLSASRYTYVPTTQLGDLYWNFGWPAVIVGMLAMGFIFARMAGAFLDEFRMTLPRFLCLLMATYYLSVYFSGNIATEYSTFVRLLIVIWLLDRLLRQMGVSRPPRRPERPPGAVQRPVPASPAGPGQAPVGGRATASAAAR
ncbi:MAG: hypothetical protein ABL989_13415 [Gammaproteobacteria bacterium]